MANSEKKTLPWGLSADGLNPGSMKTLTENKLKAFSTGTMNAVTKKSVKAKQEIEERKKRDEEKCAEVFADFVASFEDSRAKGKTFVRGNTINPETRVETKSDDTGRLYKPMTKLSAQVMEEKLKAESSPKSDMKKKAKEKEKKKSNLELFKEELKRNQQERELRHKIKIGEITDIPKDVLTSLPVSFLTASKDDPYATGSHDTGDPNTTNIYIGNISPKMNEEMLMKLFGKYGPLASVKIMWPRTEEEKSRNRNCGFVAYMRRKDGDKAIKDLGGKDIMGFEMKLGWGKAVPLPPHPIYVPPEMEEDTTPPPASGLPFNCQPDKNAAKDTATEDKDKVDPNGFSRETVANAVVKVVIPKERNLLCCVHRVLEFVVREGPMFEAMIMNREINNHMFRFLFDNQTPEHIYYRWKLFSLLQGDSQTKWKTEKFKMFVGGSWWQPPACTQYTTSGTYTMPPAAKPEDTEKPPEEPVESPPETPKEREMPTAQHSSSSTSRDRKSTLSSRHRDKLEDILRNLTMERCKIADAMTWCLEHADFADEVTECISESLSLLETPLQVKVARLYLVSDILHNCSVKIPNVSYFRKGFESRLKDIFINLSTAFKAIKARMKAEQFRKQVSRCLSAWMDWAIYPPDFLFNLQSIFLGQGDTNTGLFGVDNSPHVEVKQQDDVDGTPLNLDGVPLKAEELDGLPLAESALDGVPLPPEDLDGVPMDSKKDASKDMGIHIASKWDKPEWDRMEETPQPDTDTTSQQEQHNDEVSTPKQEEAAQTPTQDKISRLVEMDESRRKKLREIELKVAQYAQKLEAKGSRKGTKSSKDIAEQCNLYRAKLLEAIEPKIKRAGRKSRSRSKSPTKKRRRDKSGSNSRSPSPVQSSLSSSGVLQSLKGYDSRSPSPASSSSRQRQSRSRSRSSSHSRRKSRSHSRSRSPRSQRKRRSRSRSRSTSPKKSSRKRRSKSRSRSPSKKKSRKRKK